MGGGDHHRGGLQLSATLALLVSLALCATCASTSPPEDPDGAALDADIDEPAGDGDIDLPAQDADLPAQDTDLPAQDADLPAQDADPEGPSCEEMSADCASEFGDLFTASNGRADGTLLALVEPWDSQCELFNDTHVVLQLSMLGQVQRLVVSVDGVAATTATGQLLGPTYSEGWHPEVSLDYPTHLGVHSGDFTPLTMAEAVSFLCAGLEIGAPLSVFAYSDGSRPSSAHQIHRNDHYPDGAIVANPTSTSPTYLLFRYTDQVF